MEHDFIPLSDREIAPTFNYIAINNPLHELTDGLEPIEIQCLLTIASQMTRPSTLKQMCGDQWGRVRGPRKLGRRFRTSLRAGHMPQIREAGRKSKSYCYEFVPEALQPQTP